MRTFHQSNLTVRFLALALLATPSVWADPTNEDHAQSPAAQLVIELRAGSLPKADFISRLEHTLKKQPQSVFDMLRAGHYPVVTTENKRLLRALNEWEMHQCLTVFGSLPLPELRRFIAQQGSADITPETRMAVLRILGEHGKAVDMNSLLHWTVDVNSRERIPRELRNHFTQALTRLLQRDPDALAQVAKLYQHSHPALLPSMANAVGASGQPDAMATLANLLDLVPKANSLVLSEMAQSAQKRRAPIDARTHEKVLYALDVSVGSTLSAAIVAAGEMGTREAVPELIRLLKGDDKNLRKQAETALEKISKQQFGPKVDRWESWYEREQAWLQDEYPEFLRAAQHGLAGHASNALKEISKRRFYRELSAPELLPCLQRPEQELVVLTCAVLGHLSSYSSVPSLLELLEQSDHLGVQKAAFNALCRITGENHGDQAEAWRSAGW